MFSWPPGCIAKTFSRYICFGLQDTAFRAIVAKWLYVELLASKCRYHMQQNWCVLCAQGMGLTGACQTLPKSQYRLEVA